MGSGLDVLCTARRRQSINHIGNRVGLLAGEGWLLAGRLSGLRAAETRSDQHPELFGRDRDQMIFLGGTKFGIFAAKR